MKNLVIVEGPDASGKTTLAKKIAVQLKMTYLHFSGHPSLHGAMTAYHGSILDAVMWNIKHNDGKFVLDRFWPSEAVYVPVMRPHMDGVYDYGMITAKLAEIDPIYVFCMDDNITARHREEADDSHPYSDSAHARIVDGYKLLMENYADAHNVLHYDLTQPNRDNEIIEIIRNA